MSTEIDSLEIAIQAQAKDANRALANLEKHLGTIGTKLTRVMAIAQGGVSIKGIDFDKVFNGGKITKDCEKMAKQWSNAIIKNFNIGRAGEDAEKEIEDLTKKITSLLGSARSSGDKVEWVNSSQVKEAEKAMDSLANSVKKNGSIAKETIKEYQELYDWVRKSGSIPISTKDANALGDSYKERKGILKSKVYKTDTPKSGGFTGFNDYFDNMKDQGFFNAIPQLKKVSDGGTQAQFEALSSALDVFYNDYRQFEDVSKEATDSVYDDWCELIHAIDKASTSTDGFKNNLKGISDIGKSFSESFGIDTSGLEKARQVAQETGNALKQASKTSNGTSSKTKQENTQSISEQSNALFERFKDSGKNFDTSRIQSNVVDLNKEITKTAKTLDMFKEKYDKALERNDSDTLGASFKNMAQEIQYNTNKLDVLKQKLAEISKVSDVSKTMTITRNGEETDSSGSKSAVGRANVAPKNVESAKFKKHEGKAEIFQSDLDNSMFRVKKTSGKSKGKTAPTGRDNVAPKIKDATFKKHEGSVGIYNSNLDNSMFKVKKTSGNSADIPSADTSDVDATNKLATAFERVKTAVASIPKIDITQDILKGVPNWLTEKFKMPDVETSSGKADTAQAEPQRVETESVINPSDFKDIKVIDAQLEVLRSTIQSCTEDKENLEKKKGTGANINAIKQAIASIEQYKTELEQLEQLKTHLNSGGSVDTFVPTKTVEAPQTTASATPNKSSDISQEVAKIAQEVAKAKQILADDLKIGVDTSKVEADVAKIKTLEKELKQYRKIADSMRGVKASLGTIDTSTMSGKLEYAKGAVKNAFSSIANTKVGGAVGKGLGVALKGVGTVAKVAGKGLLNFGQTAKTAFSSVGSAFPLIGKLSGAIGGLTKRFAGGMIRQLVFKAISAINTALTEGVQYLAQYSGSFNNSMSSMTSSLGYVRNALTSAFSPIIEVVAPYISMLLDMVAEASNRLGQFFSALTGKSYAVQGKKAWTDYGASVADAGDTASEGLDNASESADEFQDYTLGIDELNIASTPSSSSSGSGTTGSSGSGTGTSTGTDVGSMFDTVSIDSGISDFANRIREAFNAQDWQSLGTMLGEKVNEVFNSIDFGGIGAKVGSGINGIVQTIYYFLDTIDFTNIGSKIADFFNNALANIDFTYMGRLFIKQFTAIIDLVFGFFGNLDYTLIAKSLSDFVIGAFSEMSEWIQSINWSEATTTLITSIYNFVTGIDYAGIVSSAFNLLGSALGAGLSIIWTALKTVFSGIASLFKSAFNTISQDGWGAFLQGLLDGVASIFSWIVTNIFLPVYNGFCSAFGISGEDSQKFLEMGSGVINSFIGGIKSVIGTIGEVISSIWGFITENIDTQGLFDGLVAFGEAVLPIFQTLWEGIKVIFATVAPWFQAIFEGAVVVIQTVWSVVAPFFSTIWEGIKLVFELVAPWFETIFGGAVTVITTVWSVVTTFFGLIWEGIKLIFTPVIKWFSEHFGDSYTAVTDAFKSIVTWFDEKWTGIKKVFQPVADWFKTKFTTALNNIKSAWAFVKQWATEKWNSIKEPFIQAHSWFKAKFENARDLIKEVWSKIGEWAQEKWDAICQPFIDAHTWFETKFGDARDLIHRTWEKIGEWAQEKWDAIKAPFEGIADWFKKGFQDAYDAVVGIWDGIKEYFKDIARWIISPVGNAVNGVIGGINWILDKVGSSKSINEWDYGSLLNTIDNFATGSNGLPQDTVGLVNDQKGNKYKELIVPKHGQPFIPQGRNVVLPMEKGTKIMPANQTAELMKTKGMPKFASGIGDFFGGAWNAITSFSGNILDYLESPGSLLEIAVDKFTDISSWFGTFGNIASGAISYIIDGAVDYVKKLLDSVGGGSEGAVRWAISIANDNSHGYDQASRWGCPDYDCSSLVISAFENAGIPLKSAGATYTGNMYDTALSIGFSDVTGSTNLGTGDGMRRGDILLNHANHTAMYIGDGQIVQASSNENGGITGGQAGDQTGSEIAVRSYYNYPWDSILRYSKAYKHGIGTIFADDVFPMFQNGGFPEDGLFMANHNEMIGQFNGKNAVVNNEQIVQGIAQGVYEAVVEANNNNSTQTGLLNDILVAINKGKKIVVDGRELTKAVNTRNTRNGFNFT